MDGDESVGLKTDVTGCLEVENLVALNMFSLYGHFLESRGGLNFPLEFTPF